MMVIGKVRTTRIGRTMALARPSKQRGEQQVLIEL